MNFNNHVPIYIQIIELIKRDIILGNRKPGEKLDSVREYALALKVNPNTVQKAYQEMEREGFAFTQRGIGRFIVEDSKIVTQLMQEISSEIISEYITKMHEIGYDNKEILERLEETLNGGLS